MTLSIFCGKKFANSAQKKREGIEHARL
jgi:hypothetical protein